MLAALVSIGFVATSCRGGQPGATRDDGAFATPDEAVAALSDAIRRDDVVQVRTILGPVAAVVADERDALLGAVAERMLLEDLGTGCVLLRVGFVAYRLPIALQRRGDGWRFVSDAVRACRSEVAGG